MINAGINGETKIEAVKKEKELSAQELLGHNSGIFFRLEHISLPADCYVLAVQTKEDVR